MVDPEPAGAPRQHILIAKSGAVPGQRNVVEDHLVVELHIGRPVSIHADECVGETAASHHIGGGDIFRRHRYPVIRNAVVGVAAVKQVAGEDHPVADAGLPRLSVHRNVV